MEDVIKNEKELLEESSAVKEENASKTIAPKAENVKKDLFINVYGYDDVKEELNRIREWLQNEDYRTNDKVMLPKGICFHGRPGNGKTLMLREYSQSFNAPVFVIDGEAENVAGEIVDKFRKAREEKFALVLIDEIDLVIGRDTRIERALQQEMDGINNKGSILVLCTTNNVRGLSDALTRPGRIDRLIEIDYPDKESRKVIINNFVKDLNVNDKDIDYEHVAKVCSRCSVAQLKAVCNDAFLRCGKNISTEEIELSYRRVVFDEYSNSSPKFKDKRVSLHECGHILMALNFKENWTFYKAKFSATGGYTEIQETEERTDTIEKRMQSIMIGMGGYIAEEVFYGKHDVGSYDDYNKVVDLAQRLVERVCVKGINHVIPRDYYDECDKHWTDKRANKNEKLVKRLIAKCEKKTRKYLKHNVAKLEAISKLMYDNGSISYKDIANLVNQ